MRGVKIQVAIADEGEDWLFMGNFVCIKSAPCWGWKWSEYFVDSYVSCGLSSQETCIHFMVMSDKWVV